MYKPPLRKLLVSVVAASALMIIAGVLLWLNQARPQPPNFQPEIVLNTSWGGAGSPLGLHYEKGSYAGFERFFVRGEQVFIPDPILRRIAVFEKNVFQRAYPYPSEMEIGFVVRDEELIFLDRSGFLSKMNLKTANYTQAAKPAVVEDRAGFLTYSEYTLYDLGDALIIHQSAGADICAAIRTLEPETCPAMLKNHPINDGWVVVLDQGQYATHGERGEVVLHDSLGKTIGKVRGIPSKEYLYEVFPGIQITKDGVYYVGHSATNVRIYFQRWQKK